MHEEAPPAGLPIGAPAPTFELPTLDGRVQPLEELWASGKPALLLFTNPDCGPCKELLPEVARWQRELAGKLTVGLISSGTSEANQAKVAQHGLANVLLQRENEVGEAYQAYGTPTGVLVRADGIIGSEVASGSEAISALVTRATEPGSELGVRFELLPMVNGHTHENGTRSGPPHLGEPAPELALPDLDGKRVDLAEFRGSKTLVLFWSPSCGFCQQMLGDLKAWEASPPKGAPRLLVVSTGTDEANRAQGFQSPVVLDEDFAVAQTFGSGGTPSAVLIDAEGRIASNLEVGAPRVLALAGARNKPAEVAAV
jgi:methylamine dehydrogenase accessory protein MauD